MRVPLVLSALLSTSFFLAPVQNRGLDSFPTPSAGLDIPAQETEAWTMERLLQEYAWVTNQFLIISEDTRAQLRQSKVPLGEALAINPENLHSVVETLAVQSGFVFVVAREEHPRLIAVHSLHNAARINLRQKATFVPASDMDAWREHPAFVINTVLTLDAVDTRTLTNSMRAMLTDANTQQIIPVGNTHSLILTGFAPHVADLVEMLYAVNEEARAANERMPAPGSVEEGQDR